MKKSHSISFQTIIRIVLQTLAVLTLIVAIGWLIFEPGFEPVLAILASIAVFLTPLFLNLEEKEEHEPLSFTDECEFAPEIQLDVLGMGSIVISDSGDVANFLHDYQVNFGGRQNEMGELDNWLTQTEKPFGFLVAPAGMGKSALVANWKKRLEDSETAAVVYHPISLRYGTNSQKQTLRSLLIQMSDMARKEAALEPLRSYVEGLDLIDELFSKEELQELCFQLSVDYDNLGEGGKRNKAQELIRLCQRKGHLDELVVLCREMRPHHDWDAAFSRSTPDRLLYEPPQEGDDKQILSNQLRENLRLSTGWNKPLVVIIDGLDELANQLNHSDIQEVNFLPNEVGVGVYILAVARGESVEIRGKWQRRLKWKNAPVEFFELGTLDKEGIRELVSRSKLAVEDDKLILLADKIYELSEEGDPLVASLWVEQLADLEDKRFEALLELMEKGDPGINGYIDGIFAQLEPIRSGAAKPLFEVLSLARGSLTAADLYALGIKIDSVQLNQLVSLSGRLIIRNAQSGYTFSHSRIRQAVKDKYVSEDNKRLYWLERFHLYGKCSLKRAKDLIENQVPAIPPYILNYYAQHLQEDMPPNYEPSLYALIDEVWMKAHYEHFSNYDNFLEDVDRAWTTAKKVGTEQVVNEDAVDQIAIQIKALMCHASITSLSGNLSPHLPALLVVDDIWKPKQAVSHVLRIADLAQRTHALVTLLTVDEESNQIFSSSDNQSLRNVIISSSLRDMQRLWQQNDADEAELYHLQLALSPFLSVTHVDEMLLLAGKVQRSIWQVQLLAELLSLIEDEGQQIQTIKKIIHACSKIDESFCSKDIPFIVPTFTTIAQNLSIKQLAIAFAEIWEEESHVISEQEQTIEQAKYDPSIDKWGLRELYNKHNECIESRTRKERILDYLAWHLDNHQATAFIELLLEYDSLPQVAEKIGRFARRLDDEIANDIAIRLEKEFASASQEKRLSYGMGATAGGVGMAFIALALSRKGEHQQKILQITSNYIQTYGAEDFPYGEQDLRLFYQMAVGQLTDAEAADLVKQGKFMRRFWRGEGESYLSMFSQEIVAYLGIETLKVLFERCIQSEAQGTYWHITESPYILPAIAENLQGEKLSLIYEIGHSRWESCGYYGYVRSATENIERMPEAVQLDTIQWALKGWVADIYLEQAIAPFITPDMLSDRSSRRGISKSMAKHLPPETVQYVVNNFDVSYYGEVKGNEIVLQFVQYLPEMERRRLLQNMKAELFQIKDTGELKATIETLKQRSQFIHRKKIEKISRPILSEMKTANLLESFQDGHYYEDALLGSPFFVMGNLVFSDYIYFVLRMSPSRLIKSIGKLMQLLRLNEQSHQAIRQQLIELPWWDENTNLNIRLNSWYQRAEIWIQRQLISSKATWILYLLYNLIFTTLLLLILSIVALLVLPFIGLILGGYFLLTLMERGVDWLRDRLGRDEKNKKDKAYIWKSVQNQVQALNNLSDSETREDAFVQIAHTLGSVIRLIVSRDYKEYAANAEEIWSELNPKFVLDALAVLDKHAYVESHGYVRAILPAVVFKDKSRLPDLIQYIEQPYTQLKAVQYACLSYFLTGQERLDYLEKAVAAFSYAAEPDFIIPHILTEVADYATPDLIPHLLRWLSDYPVASALEKLAPKIVNNDTWLAQGFTIAQKIDDPVYGFICGIAPNLNREGVTKAIIFVMGRDLEKEQEKCMPLLVNRWRKLSQQEIYFVWQEVLEEMKGYPRSVVLTNLNWFWDIIIELAGETYLEDVLKEILAIWSWWDVSWHKPDKHLDRVILSGI